MRVKLIGKQNIDFIGNDGKRVQGINLHMVGKNRNVEGDAAMIQFIKTVDYFYNVALFYVALVDDYSFAFLI